MKVIKDNIVGLFKFMVLLCRTFMPHKQRERVQDTRSPEAEDISGKYEALVGPSEPLVPTETVFCPKCHVVAAQIRRTSRGTEIIQHGRVLVTVSGTRTVTKEGRTVTGFPIQCPHGHTVVIE